MSSRESVRGPAVPNHSVASGLPQLDNSASWSSRLILGAVSSHLRMGALVKSGSGSLISQKRRGLTLATASVVPPRSSKSAVSRTPFRLEAQERIKQTHAPPASLHGLLDELVGIATQLTGTAISLDAPLMSAGLDSVAATELSTRLNERLETGLPSTLLFDHPSLRSVAGSLEIDDGDSSSWEATSGTEICSEVAPRR